MARSKAAGARGDGGLAVWPEIDPVVNEGRASVVMARGDLGLLFCGFVSSARSCAFES